MLTLANVGAIVYIVKNMARPMTAMVGGMVCVVNARRTKAKTITILVNDVIIIRRLGKIARMVKTITSLTGVDQSLSSLVVALSITVIKSPMLGTPATGALSADILPGIVGSGGS